MTSPELMTMLAGLRRENHQSWAKRLQNETSSSLGGCLEDLGPGGNDLSHQM
jgi:hypothetical protein